MYLQINAPELYHKFLNFHFFFLFFSKKNATKNPRQRQDDHLRKAFEWPMPSMCGIRLASHRVLQGWHVHPLPPLYRRTGEGTTPRDSVRSQAKEEAGEGFLFEKFPPFFFVVLWAMELVMIIAIIHLFDVDAVFDFQYLVALSREFPCEAHFVSLFYILWSPDWFHFRLGILVGSHPHTPTVDSEGQ